MSLKEMIKLSVSELKKLEGDLRKELMDMRFEHSVGKLLNTAAPKAKRKDLARVLTLLRAKTES